jgi:hypothetical protein
MLKEVFQIAAIERVVEYQAYPTVNNNIIRSLGVNQDPHSFVARRTGSS